MPVLLVRKNQRTSFENIVACQDLSPELDVLSVVRRGGSAPAKIYNYVKRSKADLTVLGTRGRTGLKKLLHKGPSSVLAVKPADFKG